MYQRHIRVLILFVATTSFLLSCTSGESQQPEPGVSLELAEYRKSVISDISYQLSFKIPSQESEPIAASETITFNLDNTDRAIPLDFKASRDHLDSLSINGKTAQISYTNEHLMLPSDLLTEGENTVNISFTTGETSLNRNPEYLYTLFVPDRARTAFPLFDQPDLKATYDLTLHIPAEWEAISNGPLESESTSDSTKTLEFAPTKQISSYLFSFVAGDFESITQTVNGVEMTMLHRETDFTKVQRNVDDIFELHASSLSWLEEYTDINYPFQKVRLCPHSFIPIWRHGARGCHSIPGVEPVFGGRSVGFPAPEPRQPHRPRNGAHVVW